MTDRKTKKMFIYESPDEYGDGQVGTIVIVADTKKEADTILKGIKYSEDYKFKIKLNLTKAGLVYSNYNVG